MLSNKRRLYHNNQKDKQDNKHRRSSLQVNLSYVLDLSDSENNDSSQEKSQHNNTSTVNFQKSMNKDISYVLANINEEDEALNQTCSRLREQIVNKTRELFDQEHDFCEKTRKVMTGEQVVTEKPKINIGSPILRGSNNCNIIKHQSLRQTRASTAAALDKYLETTRSQLTNNFQDESLVMGAPVTCSTLVNPHCTIHESCNTPGCDDKPKRTYVTRKAAAEKSKLIVETPLLSKDKPKVRLVEKCHILLDKIDGISLNTSKTLRQVPMELTPVQGKCILNQTSQKKSAKDLYDVIESASTNKSSKRNPSLYVNTSLDHVDSKSIVKSTDSPAVLPGQHVEYALVHSEGGNSINESVTDSDCSEENLSLIERLRNISQRGIIKKNVNNSSKARKDFDSSGIVEGTPCPATRSMLLKSQIKQNLTQRTKCSKVDMLELEKTIILDNSPLRNKERGHIICDSTDDESSQITTNATTLVKTPKVMKRKLFTQQNSPGHAVSFSPITNDNITPRVSVVKRLKRRRIRKNVAGRIIQSQFERQKTQLTLPKRAQQTQIPLSSSSSGSSQETARGSNRCLEKNPKKKRLIKSKKIVVKKNGNRNIINLINNNRNRSVDNLELQTSRRSSVFMDNKRLSTKRNRANHKIIIVATGLCNSVKDMVKKGIKRLGGATIESTVSRKTTHIVTTGVRTINLLRGIVRGCRLVKSDWITDSIEAGRWLGAVNYEIDHFSKAVKENRRDREIFGNAYVSELFATCGLIYIERNTTPPVEVLKDLISIAGGRVTDEPNNAKIIIGPGDIKENWVFDSITTGELQSLERYKNK